MFININNLSSAFQFLTFFEKHAFFRILADAQVSRRTQLLLIGSFVESASMQKYGLHEGRLYQCNLTQNNCK